MASATACSPRAMANRPSTTQALPSPELSTSVLEMKASLRTIEKVSSLVIDNSENREWDYKRNVNGGPPCAPTSCWNGSTTSTCKRSTAINSRPSTNSHGSASWLEKQKHALTSSSRRTYRR